MHHPRGPAEQDEIAETKEEHTMKIHDLISSILLVVLLSLPLAWLYQLNLSYWAESPVTWAVFLALN
jgi:hypothetical protein